jgi:hypothetical protein
VLRRLLLCCACLPAACPAEPQPLFDTHLHYTSADAKQLDPGQIIELLRDSGIERALVSGTPPGLAARLQRRAPELILPLLGVYRTPADKQNWHQDRELPERVAAWLRQGDWRGIGELHLFAPQRRSPVFLAIARLAVQHRLPLLLHTDPAVVDSLFEQLPKVQVIWAHAGAYPYPPLLADYLARYPNLHIDLSMRDQRIAPDGNLSPEWEDLLLEYPERFLVGVDTYRSERWHDYPLASARIRQWLAQLPPELAEALARGNARRLIGQSGIAKGQ